MKRPIQGLIDPLLALSISLLAVLPCSAQAAPDTSEGLGILDVELSPTEITVGDRIEAQLTLIWSGPEPTAEPQFPVWQKHWGDAEVLLAGKVVAVAPLREGDTFAPNQGDEALTGAGEPRIYRQALVLTAFTTGEIRLPEITVKVLQDLETVEVQGGGDVSFAVRSILPEAQQELAPRPPAPPRRLANDRRFTWIASGLCGLTLLAAWMLTRRLRVATNETALPANVGPLAELLQRLRRLDPTDAEPAHTGLSLGLRHFLGRSLGIPAAESTTTEIERRLRRARIALPTVDDGRALAALRADIMLLLRECDQAKFAQVQVSAAMTRDRLRQARDLAHTIDRGLRPTREDQEAVR